MARALLAAALAFACACRLDPRGRCDVREDCPPGLDCLNSVCATCAGDGECWSYTACSSEGLCEPRDGRCRVEADCASWQRCDASHTCVFRADGSHCDAAHPICCEVSPCAPLERCDPEHHCSPQPGSCADAADCPSWMDGCASGTCVFPATAGDDVLAWGTIDEQRDDRIAVARVTAPDAAETGFDARSATDGRAFVHPVTGEVAYRHTGDPGGDTLRLFNRDASVPDPLSTLWPYPADPSADDEVANDTSACPATWGPWLMQGGTGALLYGCPLGGGALWELHVDAGAPAFAAVKEPLAWSPGGYLLALDGAGELRVLDALGAGTPGALAVHDGAVLAVRTIPTGFRLAVACSAHGVDELWEIADSTRVATLLGTYPVPPPDPVAYPGLGWEVMDIDGTLYGRAFPGITEVVLKRPLAGGTTKIYDEQAFAPVLQLGPGSFLFTSP